MTNRTEQSPLHEAANLIRNRQFKPALEILVPYIKANPRSEDGWLLLSYAVQDHSKKRECLRRVLEINPGNTRAHARLAKLANPQPESVAKEPVFIPRENIAGEQLKSKKGSRWVTLTIAVIIIISLIVIAYYGYPILKTGFLDRKQPAVARQPSSPQTNTPSQVPSLTITPSSVPTITATSSPTPTPSPTAIPPTPTWAFPSPDGTLAQQMDDIQNQVSSIRELEILVDNPRYIVPQAEVPGLLSGMFLERYTREQVEDEARVLNALGLIESNDDLYDNILANLGEGLGGFFIPWRDEIFIIGDGFSGVEKFMYAHEYGHALVDQHHNLERVEGYPECIQATDRCLAITALVEGDATFLMYLWSKSYASDQDLVDIENAGFAPIDHIISSRGFPPPYVLRDLYFKYFEGQFFVEYLKERGGWSEVDSAYHSFPLTTEHILHPDKYLSQEAPIPVDLPPLVDRLGEEWRILKTDTLGELVTQMILGSSANHLVQIDPITAANAAAGWGGDQYQVFYRSNTNHVIMAVHWRWDSQGDGDEFWRAMSDYLNRRYFGQQVQESDEDCWTKINDHVTCIFRTQRDTLWLMAPDMDYIGVLLAEFPEFR